MKMIEIYAYFHGIQNGMATLSPAASIIGKIQVPVSDVSMEVVGYDSSRVLVKLPEYLAIGTGIYSRPTPDTAAMVGISAGQAVLRNGQDRILSERDLDSLSQMEKELASAHV
jgi:phage FluMu protein gp41